MHVHGDNAGASDPTETPKAGEVPNFEAAAGAALEGKLATMLKESLTQLGREVAQELIITTPIFFRGCKRPGAPVEQLEVAGRP